MSRLDLLATLDQVNAFPHALTKQELRTVLDRAIAKRAARLLDAKLLREWAKAVKDRDQWKDRKTGVTVRCTRAVDPLRAEAHHIEPRRNLVTRYDVRNGITLSYAVHVAVERHELRIEGTVFFYLGGAKFINCDFPVYFVRL